VTALPSLFVLALAALLGDGLVMAANTDKRGEQTGTEAQNAPATPTPPAPAPPTPPAMPGSAPAVGGNAPPPAGKGQSVPRNEVHKDYQSLLPARGVVAGGGGFMSMPWRIVVDLDARTLRAARGGEPGQSLIAPLPETREAELSRNTANRIEATALHSLEQDSTPQTVFTADSMGVPIIADGARAWELMPAGPITEGPAAELRELLDDLAWPKKE
jgi:hypothetical protein